MAAPASRQAVAAAVTLGNAGCGAVGIGLLIWPAAAGLAPGQALPLAAGLVFLAWLFDMADGIIARRLDAAGAFGAVLDSLCDAISFVLLPALLVLAAGGMAPLLLAAAAAYLAAGLLRLARFTARALSGPATEPSGPRLFQGLPSPAAAMALAAALLGDAPAGALPALALVLAAAMLSRLPYPDLPSLYLGRRLPWWHLLLPAAGLLLAGPLVVLALFFAAYLTLGPVLWLVQRRNGAGVP